MGDDSFIGCFGIKFEIWIQSCRRWLNNDKFAIQIIGRQHNKTEMQPRQHSTDKLEQNLLTSRYSLIDDMLTVRNSLQKQKKTQKDQKQKISELYRKLMQLENAQRYNKRVAFEYKQKLAKLQSTQNIAVALLGIKIGKQREQQQQLIQKRQSCGELRVSLMERKSKALDIFEKRKSARIQRIKQQNFECHMQKNKMNESDSQYRRQRSNEVRESQIMAKQRLKRYEQFRLAQARFNYDEKKSQMLRNHAEKLNLLKNLQDRVAQSQEVFRKTQVLNQEVEQIQSLYITGQ